MLRLGAVRAFPIARRHQRAGDRRFSPVVARQASCARAGLQIGGTCIAFLLVYVALQLLHALGRDPTLVVALAPIPLFSRFAASGVCAVPVGLTFGFVLRDRACWLRRLPAVLAAAIAAFVVTIILFA